MRARGFSSWVISSESRSALETCGGEEGDADSSAVTVISVGPSLVWLRSRAVLAAVPFSKVTVADLEVSVGVTLMEVILPLRGVSLGNRGLREGSLPEAEEVSDLLVVCSGSDVTDVDGGRHDCDGEVSLV